ncbi:MAG: 2-dehydropantoate 2-reductase [Methanobacteriota archaeon]|nr:MAG: 2-dehydropantoate 2-reductase [Euryarchaeota archaeon]
MHILIAGVGGIGGPLAADLLVNGLDVDLLTDNPDITKAIRKSGIHVEKFNGETVDIKARAYTNAEEVHKNYDAIFLIMKAYAVREAIASTSPLLKESGYFVTFQNGIIEDLILDLVPEHRIIPCTVGWGGSMISPGVYRRTSRGVNIIGELDGTISERVKNLKEILELNSETRVTTNIKGVKWSKLAINSSINSVGVITGEVLKRTLGDRKARQIFLKIYSEVVELARAQNIVPERIVADPLLFYVPPDAGKVKRFIKDRLVWFVGRRYGNVKSSSLQSLERGRPTENEYLNGYVVRKAQELQMQVPANRAVYEMVREIEEGSRSPSLMNLDELYDRIF